MTELDRQIRATLQTLVALQSAKILQVEKDNAALTLAVERYKRTEEERSKRQAAIRTKQEAQA